MTMTIGCGADALTQAQGVSRGFQSPSPLSPLQKSHIFCFFLTVTQFLWPTGRSTALQESIGKIFQEVVEIGVGG